jgi:ubiquinone/menaquinone biosynthesis C-methylase UbiE
MVSVSKTNGEANEVKALFNAKAQTWNAKYSAGGPLTFRIAAFGEILRRRLAPNAKVLDLGCGTGAIAAVLSDSGFRVTACDIADDMLAVGKRVYGASAINWCLLSADWKQLPFDACSFDAIVCSSVLEYVPEVNVFLLECQRILNLEGALLATVPNQRALARRVEKFIRPVATALDQLPGFGRMPKLHSYATYLKCSRNRMSLDEWQAVGTRSRFAAVRPVETAAQNKSLSFLLFCKASQR